MLTHPEITNCLHIFSSDHKEEASAGKNNLYLTPQLVPEQVQDKKLNVVVQDSLHQQSGLSMSHVTPLQQKSISP